MLLVLGVFEAAAVREGGDSVRVDAFDGAAAAVFVEGVDGASAREAARGLVDGVAGGVRWGAAEEGLALAALVEVLLCWVGGGAGVGFAGLFEEVADGGEVRGGGRRLAWGVGFRG